jgi:hypothetical protein
MYYGAGCPEEQLLERYVYDLRGWAQMDAAERDAIEIHIEISDCECSAKVAATLFGIQKTD